MPNSYFRFKQFQVNQDQTAMKVCTDACVLGGYAPVGKASRILDIGTGTGLLALMLAQRSVAGKFDAVEMNEQACLQARENVQASPFADRIAVHHTPIQDFLPAEKYDLIVTNPPFYTAYLQSGKQAQDNALHTNTLPTGELLQAIARLLAYEGEAWVLLPPYQMDVLTQESRQFGLYPFHRTVYHRKNAICVRQSTSL
jgi:tRNA1Val (adenine37-N6)-methyltransferase